MHARVDGHARARRTVATAAVLLAVFFFPSVAAGHGVDLSYEAREGIEIIAVYDGGQPMAGAQVAVFAPNEPAEPVLTGVCDDDGRFFFVPDPEIPGVWEVRVRDAGHGGMLRIDVAAGEIASGESTSLTNAQRALMALAVTWGLIGTALYFRRKDAPCTSPTG